MRLQRVMGVEFSYQPPPRNLVPFAASLKGHVGARYVCDKLTYKGGVRMLTILTLLRGQMGVVYASSCLSSKCP